MPRTQSTCRLLSLPPELRTTIFERYFTIELASRGDTVDLMRAKGPSSDLLFTCRQIYNEARGMHDTAMSEFWEDSDFVIDCDSHGPRKEDIDNLSDRKIRKINDLYVRGRHRFSFTRPVWTCVGAGDSLPRDRHRNYPQEVVFTKLMEQLNNNAASVIQTAVGGHLLEYH